MENKTLTFYECIELLDAAIKGKILAQDPNNCNNILIYRSAGKQFPEGWYSMNLLTVASELLDDGNGQKILLSELKKKGISFQPKPNPFLENDGLSSPQKKSEQERN